MDLLNSSPDSLKSSLRDGKITVAVYGLGHVGLGIVAVWLRAGAKVIGVDIKNEVVESINKGVSPIADEPGIPETIHNYASKGRLRATTDGVLGSKESNVKIIAVPTTLTNQKKTDLSALQSALNSIAQGLKRGDLVIIESSVPPTTTTELAKTLLERTSKLKTEEDFGLAYSPERIYEGRVLKDIEERYPKIVGGIGPRSTEAAATLYEVIAKKGILRTSSPTVAETSKLFEGIYRDVNIALANELGRFCGAIDVDFSEVREAANSQPFCHLHVPGFVGGWCIPFYPHFVLQVAKKKNMELPLTSLARKTNQNKPQLLVAVADKIMKELNGKGLKGSKVAVLGLSFRADVPDTRNSPSYEVIDLLLKKQVSGITAFDPYVAQELSLRDKGIQIATNIDDATRGADLIILMTDHSTFSSGLTSENLLREASAQSVLIDGRHILPRTNAKRGTKPVSSKIVEGFYMASKSAD